MTNVYVTPVGSATELPPAVIPIPTPRELTEVLSQRGVNIIIGESLKGGTVSQVYEAREDGMPVVVKNTTDCYDNDPTVLFLSHAEHFVDTAILKYLASKNIRVPRVLHDFNDIPLTVMEDMRASGFTLFNDHVVGGSLPAGTAESIGHGLARLLKALAEQSEFETIESSHQCYYERGLELRQAYPNDQAHFNTMEHRFTTSNQQLVAVDTHPKNMFIGPGNEIGWIDFGRSVWGDRDFVLPNCLAHIAIYSLAGSIPRSDAANFIETAVVAYRELLPIEDGVLVTYLAAEVMHRWAGKWISGIDTSEKKLALLKFGMKIFDEGVDTLSALTNLLRNNEAAVRT